MTSGEARFEEVSADRTRIEVTMNYAEPLAALLSSDYRLT